MKTPAELIDDLKRALDPMDDDADNDLSLRHHDRRFDGGMLTRPSMASTA
jgi:hypothetical protein